MGEGEGQGVGIGRRVILVFFSFLGCLAGEKRGGRVFSFFDFFWRAAFWLGRFLCWCV